MPPLASEIMDSASALNNDVPKHQTSYTNVTPYLKIALRDFSRMAARAGLSVSNKTSAVLLVPAGTTQIDFTTNPALPSDLIDIDSLYQSDQSTGLFTEVTPRRAVDVNATPISGIAEWVWEENAIKFAPSSTPIYVKVEYLRALFTTFVDQNSDLRVINSQSFLEYRTGGLVARYIFENPERAQELDGHAGGAFDDIVGIDSKGKQNIPVRRAPFRSGRRYR